MRHWLMLILAFVFEGCIKKLNSGKIKSEDSGDVTISLVGLNDFHGSVESTKFTLKSLVDSKDTEVGGIPLLAEYLRIHREKYPNTLVLNAGDIFQGTFISHEFQGASVAELLNSLKIDAGTLGNHELDFGPALGQPSLVDLKLGSLDEQEKDRGSFYRLMKLSEYPFLIANVRKKSDQNVDALATNRSKIFNVGGVRVGVIGVATKTTPEFAPVDTVDDLNFLSLEAAVPKEVENLRKQGASIVILLAHAGGACRMNLPAEQGDSACSAPVLDELSDFLKKYPKLLDAVVAGHSHLPQAHFIFGTPVIQTSGFGLSFGNILVSGKREGESLLNPKFEIKKPTYLCTEHFENYTSCNPDEIKHGGDYPESGFGNSVPANYLGQNVKSDEKVFQILQKWKQKVKSIEEEFITTLPVQVDLSRNVESSMGNCVTDILFRQLKEKKVEVDLVFLGTGQLRSGFSKGDLNFSGLYKALPGDDVMAFADLEPAELQELIRAMSAKGADAVTVALSEGWKAQEGTGKPRIRSVTPSAGAVGKVRWKVSTTEWKFRGFESLLEKAQRENRIHFAPVYGLRNLVKEGLKKELPKSCVSGEMGRTQKVE